MGIAEMERMVTTRRSIKLSADKLAEFETIIAEVKQKLIRFKDEYRKQLQHLGKCPLCLTDIGDKVEEIIENL